MSHLFTSKFRQIHSGRLTGAVLWPQQWSGNAGWAGHQNTGPVLVKRTRHWVHQSGTYYSLSVSKTLIHFTLTNLLRFVKITSCINLLCPCHRNLFFLEPLWWRI